MSWFYIRSIKTKKMRPKGILFLFAAFFLAFQLSAQSHVLTSNSTATVIGTSSLHDWESEVKQIEGTASFIMEGNSIKEIQSLNVRFGVKSIESGKSKMNSLTYEALKESAFPQITYVIKSVESFDGQMAVVSGELTIVGVTKTKKVTGAVQVNGNSISISGRTKVDMTEFNIEPPTAMGFEFCLHAGPGIPQDDVHMGRGVPEKSEVVACEVDV